MQENIFLSKEWVKVQDGFAKRFLLEDHTPVIAFLRDEKEETQLAFYADVADLDCLELHSEKLGGLPDLIDVLQPADIIEICCCMDSESDIC